jgi:DNA-directed RNA polymerase specialized sigma24 family protein
VWEDVSPAVLGIAGAFAARRGLDAEEIKAEAGLYFCEALDRYRRLGGRGRSPFRAYARFYVHKQLLEAAERKARKARILPVGAADMNLIPQKDRPGVAPILAGLGADALTVCRLLFDMVDQPRRGLRGRLAQALAGLGWGAARVAESFEEVANALRG